MRFTLVVLVGVMFAGCAATQPLKPFTAFDLNPKLKSGDYVQKTDSFLVVLDASGSMAEGYKGDSKFNIARNFVHGMNQTIPDLKLTGGLRKFGGTHNPFAKKTGLVYGMTDYSRAGFEEGLNMVKAPKGETPMAFAIKSAGGDLKSAPGKMALIVVGDGRATDFKSTNEAKNLKSTYGDRLCIYTVAVGNDPEGVKRMQRIADAGRCGSYINADSVSSGAQMAEFVENIFLAKVKKPAPPPPPPRRAPAPPGVPDSDRDGVPDDRDKCPGTPLGARVNDDGCWILGNVLFDFDQSKVKAEYHGLLKGVVAVMNRNPSLKLELNGFTCNMGPAKYNMGLSMRRAKAVAAYLSSKGISKGRLITKSYGLTKPAASNATRAGRKLNRRVELRPTF
ncbi:MAG: OmpA family protein [Deltaproteobacteria bacterium]|nr:OmpA family protein [Deltaproteobacteria bacterium]